jgi:hypothetical protein
MTEADWLAGRDPYAMLRYLHFLRCTRRGRPTDPKVRLLACHGCRAVGHLLRHDGSRQAFRAVEAVAGGDAGGALAAAVAPAEAGLEVADADWRASGGEPARLQARAVAWAAEAVFYAVGGRADRPVRTIDWKAGTAGQVFWAVRAALVCEAGPDGAAADRAEHARQVRLVHELFGNPFRPAVVRPEWRTDAVAGLARAVQEAGAFDRLPALAEALERAGCTDESLLEHCRGPGPHVRGCWAVDLLTGADAGAG